MDSGAGGAISAENKAVFDQITQLVTGVDFQSSTYQFLDKHKDVFTDDEENKLEYSTIFEEYVQILEQVIDSKLMEKFTGQQIKAFYSDFTANFAEYEKINKETVEIVFGFTDFNRFKILVLQIKNGEVEVQRDASGNASGSKVGLVSDQFFWDLFNEDHSNKSSGWEKRLEAKTDDVEYTTWRRPVEKSGDFVSRTEVLYKGIRIETLVELFRNFNKYNDKRDQVLEEKFLEFNDDGTPAKAYTRFKIPMMSERESLVKMKVEQLTGEHDGKFIFLVQSYDDPAYPINSKVIRMTTFQGIYIYSDGDSTRTIQFAIANMGGYFPMSLLRMAMSSIMKKQMDGTMDKLKQIQKDADEKK